MKEEHDISYLYLQKEKKIKHNNEMAKTKEEHAQTSDVGFLHQILSGLDYTEEKFEEGMADGSKLPWNTNGLRSKYLNGIG